jgi:hypothetical protein
MGGPVHKRVIIDLAFGEEPIQGWVRDGDLPPRAFVGWLALSAALDAARADGASAAGGGSGTANAEGMLSDFE